MEENLIDTISGIIYDNIPLNLHCPHCDRDLDIENVLDLSDVRVRENMCFKIIHVVFDRLVNMVLILDNDDIRSL